jgi:hypothetical protein
MTTYFYCPYCKCFQAARSVILIDHFSCGECGRILTETERVRVKEQASTYLDEHFKDHIFAPPTQTS